MPNSVSQASLTGDFTLFTSGEKFPYERFALRVSDSPMLDFLTDYSGVEGNNLNSFWAALETAGLTDLLTSDTPLTIFAPSDAAFEQAGGLEALSADPEALAALLKYHMVPEYLPSYLMVGEKSLATLHGDTLESAFVPAESFTINGNTVGLENRVANGWFISWGQSSHPLSNKPDQRGAGEKIRPDFPLYQNFIQAAQELHRLLASYR